MLNRARKSAFAILVVLVAVVSAPLRSPAQGSERVLRFWHPYTQPQRAKEMQRAADEFERANPGIKVEVEIVPWAHINARWRDAQAAGTLPDVGVGNPPDYVDMWQSGAILPVDDVIGALGGDGRFIPGILDRHARFQGKTLAVPHYMHALVLIYRKDLLAATGLEPPVDWDDLLRVSKALNAPPERYGFQQLWSREVRKSSFLLLR